MAYRTEYLIQGDLPQSALQVVQELFSFHADDLTHFIGSCLMVFALGLFIGAVLLLLIHVFKLKVFFCASKWLATTICISEGLIASFLICIMVCLPVHNAAATDYTSGKCIVIDGTVSNFEFIKRVKDTQCKFQLGGRNIVVSSNCFGFNDVWYESFKDGNQIRIWIDPDTNTKSAPAHPPPGSYSQISGVVCRLDRM